MNHLPALISRILVPIRSVIDRVLPEFVGRVLEDPGVRVVNASLKVESSEPG